MTRRVAVLGSTGSIGTQALDVMAGMPERFRVAALAARSNARLLVEQVKRFAPDMAVLTEPPEGFAPPPGKTRWAFGNEARDAVCADSGVDDVIVSVVGMTGLSAVLTAIKHKKRVLLANKETLMAGGELVMGASAEYGVPIVPIDSEHTAILQCLWGKPPGSVEKLLLTASGGPFRLWEKQAMDDARAADALNHPTWNMGAKITIDSATMMNKAIEIAEAHYLFGVKEDSIEVVVHPQSIVHSAVQFVDGSILAHLSRPDMRIPILYALTGEDRLDAGFERLSLFDMPRLTFERMDDCRFPCVGLVRGAIRSGGNALCVVNAANECAVEAFLRGQIRFGGIYPLVSRALDALYDPAACDLNGIMHSDGLARRYVGERLAGRGE